MRGCVPKWTLAPLLFLLSLLSLPDSLLPPSLPISPRGRISPWPLLPPPSSVLRPPPYSPSPPPLPLLLPTPDHRAVRHPSTPPPPSSAPPPSPPPPLSSARCAAPLSGAQCLQGAAHPRRVLLTRSAPSPPRTHVPSSRALLPSLRAALTCTRTASRSSASCLPPSRAGSTAASSPGASRQPRRQWGARLARHPTPGASARRGA